MRLGDRQYRLGIFVHEDDLSGIYHISIILIM